MTEGVDGLLRDNTRPSDITPLAPSLVDKVVALTLEPPCHEDTHWTVRAMVKAVSVVSIQPAYIIAWSCWRRAHQAAARRAHLKSRMQLSC